MPRNWKAMESTQESLQKMIARRKRTANFMSAEMGGDEVYDPQKEVVIKISEAETSTLNRLAKSVNAMYKATQAQDVEIRETLLKKKAALLNELNKREETK